MPLDSSNEIAFVVDESVVPFNVIDHCVPEGSPDSVNVTLYVLN